MANVPIHEYILYRFIIETKYSARSSRNGTKLTTLQSRRQLALSSRKPIQDWGFWVRIPMLQLQVEVLPRCRLGYRMGNKVDQLGEGLGEGYQSSSSSTMSAWRWKTWSAGLPLAPHWWAFNRQWHLPPIEWDWVSFEGHKGACLEGWGLGRPAPERPQW